ncbi:MAG: hypothetical protein IT210_07395 [Armatimonadetes bacterium]|nr:hypothetical protein [Armatimonadota bacterium]
MALVAVEGVYRDGRIELSETPEGVDESQVLVVFIGNGAALESDADQYGAIARNKAVALALEDMRKGVDLGGPPYPKREDLYDRFDRKPASDGGH